MMHQDLLSRGVLHDMNGLMARVALTTEQLCAHSDQRVAERAERISVVIDQMSAICRDYFAPRERKAELMGAASLERLMRQTADLVSAECALSAKPLDFFISVGDDVALEAHAASVFRVIFNLALNSANAIAKHGGSWIEISAMTTGGRVFFDICDDGPGLPDHILRFLFPSLEADAGRDPGGRIGYGLITAVSLAAELKGEIRLIKSTPAGTSFCFSLPEREPRAAGVPASPISERVLETL